MADDMRAFGFQKLMKDQNREMTFRGLSRTSIVFIICSALLSAGEAVQTREFIRRRNFVLQNGIVQTSVTASSAAQCVGLCTQTSQCESASWGSNDHLCKLSDRNTWFIFYDDLSVSPTYHTYTWILWKVWIIRGPGGDYSLSYTEAAAECAKTDGRLATEAELLAERALRFDECTCGWLAEGTNGFVVQAFDRGCWWYFTTGIHFCNRDTANAVCVFGV